MSLKNTFQEVWSEPKKRIELFYISAKMLFSLSAFVFFIAYFCVSANFYPGIFLPFFLPLYLVFVLSFGIFTILTAWKHLFGRVPRWGIILCNIVSIVLSVIFLFPIF